MQAVFSMSYNNYLTYTMRNSKTRRSNMRKIERSVNVTGVTGLPDNTRVRLHYEDMFNLAPAAAYATHTFRGNSVYDPDYTATGHQPRYFDHYSSVYERYKVLGSSIRVDLINGSATSGVVYTLCPLTDPISPNTLDDVSELPRTKISEIVPIASRLNRQLSHSMRTTVILGLPRNTIADQDFSALITNNPNSIWYWNLSVFSVDNTTNVGVSVRVSIVFDVIFYDRKETPVSYRILSPEKHKKEKLHKDALNVHNVVSIFHE